MKQKFYIFNENKGIELKSYFALSKGNKVFIKDNGSICIGEISTYSWHYETNTWRYNCKIGDKIVNCGPNDLWGEVIC